MVNASSNVLVLAPCCPNDPDVQEKTIKIQEFGRKSEMYPHIQPVFGCVRRASGGCGRREKLVVGFEDNALVVEAGWWIFCIPNLRPESQSAVVETGCCEATLRDPPFREANIGG